MDKEEAGKTQSLDTEIAKISKSTRTTVPALLPLHDVLRQKYRWYYRIVKRGWLEIKLRWI